MMTTSLFGVGRGGGGLVGGGGGRHYRACV